MKIILFSTLFLAWVQHAVVLVAAQTCPCFDVESIPVKMRAARYSYGTFYVIDKRGVGPSFDISCAEASVEELVICQEQFNSIMYELAESLPFRKAGLAETCPCWLEGLDDLPNPSVFDIQRSHGSSASISYKNYQDSIGTSSSKLNVGSYNIKCKNKWSSRMISESEHNRCYKDIAELVSNKLNHLRSKSPTGAPSVSPAPTDSPSVTPTIAPVAAADLTCPCFEDMTTDPGSVENKAVHGSSGSTKWHKLGESTPSGTRFYSAYCDEARAHELVKCQEQLDSAKTHLFDAVPFPDEGIANTCSCSEKGRTIKDLGYFTLYPSGEASMTYDSGTTRSFNHEYFKFYILPETLQCVKERIEQDRVANYVDTVANMKLSKAEYNRCYKDIAEFFSGKRATESPVASPSVAPADTPTESPIAFTQSPIASPTVAPVAYMESPIASPSVAPAVYTESSSGSPSFMPVVYMESPVAPPSVAPIDEIENPLSVAPASDEVAICELEYVLYNADENKPLHILAEMECIEPFQFNIQVQPKGDCLIAGSAQMELSGPRNFIRSENKAPFMIFGDDNGDIKGRGYIAGNYTIATSLYSERRAGGNLLAQREFSFTMTKNCDRRRTLRGGIAEIME